MENVASFKDQGLLYISLNQDQTCIVAGTERGFKIFDIDPFKLKFERILDGGIGIIEMLYKTNILALVGGGKNPKYTPNKVILWDDYQTKILYEFKFTTSVKNVKLKKDRLIVICEHVIHIYDTEKYRLLDQISTFVNPRGVVAVNTDPAFTVLAFPDGRSPKGFVKVKAYEHSLEVTINAHETSIAALGINNDGTLLASADEQGKIIRIFYVQNGEFIEEFSRGKDKCLINYICFDMFSNWMAACNDKGMIHIWSMGTVWNKVKSLDPTSDAIQPPKSSSQAISSGPSDPSTLPANRRSFLDLLPSFLTGGAFKNALSFAWLRALNEEALIAFPPGDAVIAVTASGKVIKARFDRKNGGECPHLKMNEIGKVEE